MRTIGYHHPANSSAIGDRNWILQSWMSWKNIARPLYMCVSTRLWDFSFCTLGKCCSLLQLLRRHACCADLSIWLYVYMCIYMLHMYIHTYVRVTMYIYIYDYIHICEMWYIIYIFIYLFIYLCMYVLMSYMILFNYIYIYICVCVSTKGNS